MAQMNGQVLVSAGWDLRIIALGSLVFLMALCMVGVAWVIKFQLMLLFLLVGSILSVIIGVFMPTDFVSPPSLSLSSPYPPFAHAFDQ